MSQPAITFEPLPHPDASTRKGTGKHAKIADALRKNPGKWARVLTLKATSARTMAYAIKAATMPCYGPAGSFEAKSRTVDGQCHVYARYVGGAQ